MFVLRDELYPIVENAVKDKKRFDKLILDISRYYDRYVEIYSSPIITKLPKFLSDDREMVFTFIDVSDKDVEAMLKKLKLPSGLMATRKENITPFNVALALVILASVKNKIDSTKINILLLAYAMSVYSSLYTKYYRFPPKREVMEYTVNNMTQKFKLKQSQSLGLALQSTLEVCIETYQDQILKFDDDFDLLVVNYVYANKTRLNSLMRNITSEYIQAYKNKDVIFSSSAFGEDGDLLDTDNSVGRVESLADEYTTKFFSGIINQSLIDSVARQQQVGKNDLRSSLTLLIQKQAINDIKDFYRALFYIFLIDEKQPIEKVKTIKFLQIGDAVYKKGNTKDVNVLRIKDLIHKWLQDGSPAYKKSKSETTINGFRKAIYYYMILLVSTDGN